jgi:hypothetical protein
MPCASYQCSSALRIVPSGSRIKATPLSLRQRPLPYSLSSRLRARIPAPAAILSSRPICPTTSNGISSHVCRPARSELSMPRIVDSPTCLLGSTHRRARATARRGSIACRASRAAAPQPSRKHPLWLRRRQARTGSWLPQLGRAVLVEDPPAPLSQRGSRSMKHLSLEPDVARAFPDSSSVNRALRLPRDVATKSAAGVERQRRAAASSLARKIEYPSPTRAQ